MQFRTMGSRAREAAVALALLSAGGTTAQAEEFPFGQELSLDARRLAGSKRIPSIEIDERGATRLELWCKGGSGQFSVAGDTVVFVAGPIEDRGCPADKAELDDALVAALGEATTWKREGDYVTFTGSPATGAAIQKAAAQNNRGVTMELGGKSPQIVFADADIEAALPVLVNAIIQNGGQTCSAGSRVLIEKLVYDRVASALAERFAKLVAGPHESDLDLGPLVNKRQAERVSAMVADARSAGVSVLAEGSVHADAPSGGFYQAPVLFGSVDPAAEIAREEVFGPVLCLFSFETEEEAVRLANGTDYGLVAGIWTKDGARQHRVAKRVRAGQVFVNGYGAGGGIELPFGGFGKSGHGREKGFEALYDMSATKTVVFNHG